MYLGSELRNEQKQTATMTPELIQAIKILQYNTQELNEYIEEQILSNPMLELCESEAGSGQAGVVDDDFEDALRTTNTGSADSQSRADERRRKDFDWVEYLQTQGYDDISYGDMKGFSSEPAADILTYAQDRMPDITLKDHLMQQLGFSSLSGKACEIGKYIIDSLDNNGYLTQSIREIAAKLQCRQTQADEVLCIIKTFEPTGIGASGLSECLLMQLDKIGMRDNIMQTIIENHMSDIASNHLTTIANKCGISKQEAQRRTDIIRRLESKPGRAFSDGSITNYLVPDVIVEKSHTGYVVSLPADNIPQLTISSHYRTILRDEEKHSAVSLYLSQRLSTAMWLIRSVAQRKDTICRVAESIVRLQSDFFDKGTKYLKPLTLMTVSYELGLHESTISRTVVGKYMQTPRGIFEMKYFFSGGTGANSKRSVASGGVKVYIEELIKAEDPRSPISDQSIADKLQMDDIVISRRTVAKYRETMGIPPSSARRRI